MIVCAASGRSEISQNVFGSVYLIIVIIPPVTVLYCTNQIENLDQFAHYSGA